MNVAQTILSQIKTLDSRALFAWGARDMIDMGNGIKFKTSGMTPYKGYVYIKYNEGNDLYDIQFFRIRNMLVTYDQKVNSVYAENLVSVIDDFVG